VWLVARTGTAGSGAPGGGCPGQLGGIFCRFGSSGGERVCRKWKRSSRRP